MSDPQIATLMSRIAQAIGHGGPVDWHARPDREVTHAAPSGRVEVSLRGFTVTDVRIDSAWLREAPHDDVEAELRKAFTGALAALVDAEVDAAMHADYEQAPVRDQLIQLSREAGGLFDDQLRALGRLA
ncbi:hypothetical protein GCM10025789_10040 [Tessaracoccus lubricantis]|uniref:YbaB/EbfC family DNA-binding protein n=1 Tax=Tessaracoccus lubricantis TaxID=545543 RepID=A0ABP9FCI5_9ACTN